MFRVSLTRTAPWACVASVPGLLLDGEAGEPPRGHYLSVFGPLVLILDNNPGQDPCHLSGALRGTSSPPQAA